MYVAKCVHVPPYYRRMYVALLETHFLSLWYSLKREGYLALHKTYELVRVEAEGSQCPEWVYLHLSLLPETVDGKDYLKAEEEQHSALWKAAPGMEEIHERITEVRRIEVLEPTPEAYYPEPIPGSSIKESKIYYWIEYIDVEISSLDEYREVMLRYSGPAIRDMVKQGLFFNFMALETVSVEYKQEEMRSWNQIHICGLSASYPVDRAMSQFRAGIKKYYPDGYEKLWTRLSKIRHKPRDDLTRELVHLRVGG